jgi:hypothetical protein
MFGLQCENHHRGFGSNKKKMRTAQHTDVEDARFQWFKNVRDQNIPISGSTLVVKADDLAIRWATLTSPPTTNCLSLPASHTDY